MPSIQIHADATLNAQQNMLLKLVDDYGEAGNQHVTSAALWARPIIADFIAIVKERHHAIQLHAEQSHLISHDIVRGADHFLDDIIELVVSAYPRTASHSVRAITSKIRNDLAIARLDTKANFDKKKSALVAIDNAKPIETIRNEKMTSKKFQEFCQRHPEERDAVSGIVFSTPLFYTVAQQCARHRQHLDTASEGASGKEAIETYFDAFCRYWASFPHGHVYLGLAIKKLIHNDDLLKHVIRYRSDVEKLLLSYSPTVEIRKQVLQNVLKNNYLSLKGVVRIFAELPEGANINWRVDRAEFGVRRYQFISQNKNPETWDDSKNKTRSEVYEKLLDHYKYATALEKKIIVYALLESDGKRLQQLVCHAMGYSRTVVTKNIFHTSIKQDTAQFKIDMDELEKDVIEKIVANVNSGKTVESGAYNLAIEKLKQLIPSPSAMNSSFG
jgi:hypothetical protein